MDERTRPRVTGRAPPARAAAACRARVLALIACGVAIGRAHFTADLSAFLPSAPSAGQRVLVDQLRDGVVSRLILVAIDGGDATTRAALSRRVAGALRTDPHSRPFTTAKPRTTRAIASSSSITATCWAPPSRRSASAPPACIRRSATASTC